VKQNRNVMMAVLGLLGAAALFWLLRRVQFDWGMFWQQLRHVSWIHIAIAIALIYGTYWLRAMRWAEFCRAAKPMSAKALVGPQFVGFTAVALFGRLADLVRPYLLAKRTGLPVSSQVAVYTVERMFDLGAAAVVFSSALAFTPAGMGNRGTFVKVGVGSLAATLAIAAFAVVIRLKGEDVARLAERMLRGVSPKVAHAVADKILGFREGLRAVSSVREFAVALGISLLMWAMIGGAYVQTAHAFPETPELANLNFSRTMLLMAVSLGGSLVQLPVLGWFTQIAATAAAMVKIYGAPIEASTACGALLLIVLTLSIVPMGLIFARIEGVSLRPVEEPAGEIAPEASASR
jgi:uncharacterized protein (TIRG00374 family)